MTAAELRACGNAALALGKLDEARALYRRAADADPKDPVPWLNLGFVNVESRRWAEAEEALSRAIALSRPGEDLVADARYLHGVAQRALGNRESALAEFRTAAAARAQFPEPRIAAAWVLFDLDRVAEALAVLDALLAEQPNLAMAHEGHGNMLLRLDRVPEALAAFERAATLEETAVRQANVALALHRLARNEEASARMRRALALDSGQRDDAHDLSAILLEMLQLDPAVAMLERAAGRHPDDPNLGWGLAVARLLGGDLPKGFAAFEHRFLCDASAMRKPAADFERPRWTGRESLAGRTILISGEQGLGDSIQMLRYVPRVAAQAHQVWIQLTRSVAALATDLPRNCRVLTESDRPPATDFQIPTMSLPLALGTTLATIPSAVPYLEADPARVAAWRKRLDALGRVRRVGVAWSGNPTHRDDRRRSIPLETFRAIAASGVQFVSLQPEVRAADRDAYGAWAGLARFGEELRDFADTAALVGALDLVIAVDTSVAHLAGAMGRPLWILLPHYPDWRWLLERTDSPWYPTARLWRQPAPRAWPAVLRAVREELERVKGIEPSS